MPRLANSILRRQAVLSIPIPANLCRRQPVVMCIQNTVLFQSIKNIFNSLRGFFNRLFDP